MTQIKLKGEGDTKTIIRTRVRRKCKNCGEPATMKHTYLMANARNNPASSAYRHDDCTWCSDHELYLCENCKQRDCEADVPDSYEWCSTFIADRMPHLFLYWSDQEVELVIRD